MAPLRMVGVVLAVVGVLLFGAAQALDWRVLGYEFKDGFVEEAQDFGVDLPRGEQDMMAMYQWGATLWIPDDEDDPFSKEKCTDHWFGDMSGCQALEDMEEAEASEGAEEGEDAGSTRLMLGFLAMMLAGVTLLVALAGTFASRGAWGPWVGVGGTALYLVSVVLTVSGGAAAAGEMADGFESVAGDVADTRQHLGLGLWLGFAAVVLLATGSVLALMGRQSAAPAPKRAAGGTVTWGTSAAGPSATTAPTRPAAAPAQAPGRTRGRTTAGAAPRTAPGRPSPAGRTLVCPRCSSRVTVPPGTKPSCTSCGFGA